MVKTLHAHDCRFTSSGILSTVTTRLAVGCVTALAILTGCAPGGRESTPGPARIAEELPPMQEVCSVFRAQKPADRMAWTFAKTTFPLDAVPHGARLSALRQIASLRAAALAAAAPEAASPRWISIGPAPILVVESGVERATAGRVASIAVDPSEPGHWLIGAAHGGIWETRNSGTSWEPRTDDQLSLAMGAIAFASSHPRIVFAGTGEAVFSRSTYGGEGLLQSRDGGRTWQPLATTEFSGAAFSDLAVDPSNADVIVAATTHAGVASIPGTPPVRGVMKSKSGGQTGTWAQMLPGEATDLKVIPGDFSKQYAGIGDICGDARNGVYRSLDGGDQWQAILGSWTATGAVGRVELAISPSKPNVLYVSIQRAPDASFVGGDLLGLWRTDNAWDATPVWREIPSAKDLDLGNGTRGSYCSYVSSQRRIAQCWYDHVLSVDPANADMLYVGGIELWRYDGRQWTAVGRRPELHVDQHAMAWVGRRLIVGNDGGVWSTTDPIRGWTPHNDTLATNQIWRGSIDPTNDRVALAGNQDDGTTRWTDNSRWQSVYGGDGAASAIAGNNPSTHWAVSYQRAGFARTKNGGATRFEDAASAIGREPEDTRPFITPLEKCPSNDDVFVAGTIKPWRTENFFTGRMPDWTVNGPDMGALIRALAFAPSDTTCRTYVLGTVDGALRRTTSGGGSAEAWSPLDPNDAVAKRMVTSLAFHPTDANILYVTVGGFDQGTPSRPGHVFRTTNALSASPQWISVRGTSNLPHNAVAFDPVDPRVIYVGTDVGLWYTKDGGAHWDHMGPERGLPNVAISDVRVHPRTRRVFAFTFGRGVFVLDPSP